MSTLNLEALTLDTNRGTWRVEAQHERPGGDLDVVATFHAVGTRYKERRFYGYRYDATDARWSQLAGMWDSLADIERAIASVTARSVLTYLGLVDLLEAARLADAPGGAE